MKVLTENKEELAVKDLIESDIDDMPFIREKNIQEEVDIDENDVGEMVFEDADDDDLGDELNFSNMFDDEDDDIDTTIPDEDGLDIDDYDEEIELDDEE